MKKTSTINIPVSLRSFENERDYIEYQKVAKKVSLLDEPAIKEWKYWKIINNSFPYSYAFKTHHMLIPKRQVCENDLSKEEQVELDLIYKEIGSFYDCRLINFIKKQSIKDHYHVHLLIYKDNREDLEA